MSRETAIRNARIVLQDRVVLGSLLLRDGEIAAIDGGASQIGLDWEGDYLIPGLVELHTDHLEGHYSPRPGVAWNKTAAIQAYDAQISSSGITTVFDCFRMGSDEEGGYEREEMRHLATALQHAQDEGRLRAEHFIHLRCEVSADNVLDHFQFFRDDQMVRIMSLMDHAPGQRQFQTMDQYELYYKTSRGMTDEEFDAFVKRRVESSKRNAPVHRKMLADHALERDIVVASHDDATLEHVEEARGFGVRLAEFPTSFVAADASHKSGMSVLMGAPNVVRGGSHSGNVAAKDLAVAGVLDVLSSDYIPFSLIHAPFILVETVEALSLPQAIAMVTATPARTVGLDDRGIIDEGKRADLVRVRHTNGVPIVREVWRQGARVS